MVQIFLEVQESVNTIEKLMLVVIARRLDRTFRKAADKIRTEIRDLTAKYIKQSPITKSLLGQGDKSLMGHFGFPKGSEADRILPIINNIVDKTFVQYRPIRVRGRHIVGGLSIGILSIDYEKLEGFPTSTIITEKGTALNWLEWLLEKGTNILIRQFDITFDKSVLKGRSRSGLAIMISSNVQGWSVPEWAAGTRNDNWLTRSILDRKTEYETDLDNLIEIQIKKVL